MAIKLEKLHLADFILINLFVTLLSILDIIKTHGSESRGQEEAVCMRIFGPMRPLQ